MELSDFMLTKIGFVILVWNSERVIGKCLESISNLKSIEPMVVVVDNGSVDNTIDIVNEYIEKLDLSIITYPINMGTTISRNAGLLKLKAMVPDYLCVLDSDTEVNDEAFVALLYEMSHNPSYGIIGPNMATSSGYVQDSARAFPTVMEKLFKAIPIHSLQVKGEAMEKQAPLSPDSVSYPVDYLMSAFWLMRPDLIDKVGLLDERIFYAPEDAEYCIRVWKSGYQVAYCPQARIIHEWQRISKKKLISKMNWEHIKGLCYMFWKHRYCISTKRLKALFTK